GDGRIGDADHIGDAGVKVDKAIEAGFSGVDKDKNLLQAVAPRHKARPLARKGPLDGAPAPYRRGFAELITNAILFRAPGSNQQAAFRVMDQEVRVMLERQAYPFAGVHIDLEQQEAVLRFSLRGRQVW